MIAQVRSRRGRYEREFLCKYERCVCGGADDVCACLGGEVVLLSFSIAGQGRVIWI